MGGTKANGGAWMGVLAILLGLGTAVGVHLNPEGLHAPAWVAYLACGVFVAAGASMLLRSAGRGGAATWLAFTIPLAFTVIAAWIAFGPGPRTCTASLGFFSTTSGATGCRAVFGVSALLCGAATVLFARGLLRGR